METAIETAMETAQHRLRQPADGRRRRRLVPAMQMTAAIAAARDGRRRRRLIQVMQMTAAAIEPRRGRPSGWDPGSRRPGPPSSFPSPAAFTDHWRPGNPRGH